MVIKAGRNQDAWRLNTPCENIVIRHCDILKGHTLLGIGSEMSGGVRNVYMHNCTAPDSVFRLFFAKTNHRRGGFIENIWMKNVKAGKMQRVLKWIRMCFTSGVIWYLPIRIALHSSTDFIWIV